VYSALHLFIRRLEILVVILVILFNVALALLSCLGEVNDLSTSTAAASDDVVELDLLQVVLFFFV
jgi:hypothetical protein